jgi:hypothetical protein
MPTITVTNDGFAYDGNISPKGHFQLPDNATSVDFVLASNWIGPGSTTVSLPTNIFKHPSIAVSSTAVSAKTVSQLQDNSDGRISCASPAPTGSTMTGQIDVVPGDDEDR